MAELSGSPRLRCISVTPPVPRLHAPLPLPAPLPAPPAPAEKDLGEFVDSFTASVPVHDVAALRVTPLEGPLDDGWRPWHGQPMYEAQDANLVVQFKADWVGEGAPWRDIQGETAVPVYERGVLGGGGDDGGGGKKGRRLAAAPE